MQGRRDPGSNLTRRSRRGLKWGWDAGPGPKGEPEGIGGKGRGRGGGEEGGRCRPARLLLAGRSIFWQEARGGWRGVERGGGGGDLGPGGGEGMRDQLITGGGVITGQEAGITGGGVGVTRGGVGIGGGGKGGHGNNPSDLKLAGTGADDVARLAAVGAETTVVPAAAFFGGKATMSTSSTVDVHGGRGGMVRAWLARGGGQNGLGKERKAGRGGGVGTRLSGGRLILLDGDGCRDVGLKLGGEVAAGGKLEPNNLF